MKITGYTALTSVAANDELVIVDVSDTTMAASGTTKNITTANLLAGASGAGAPVFNVKAAPYNATGNGTTDDTTAIQAAVTAGTAGGGVIYFPPGTYLVSSSLLVGGGWPGGVVIAGAGWTSQILLAAGANTYLFDFGSGGSPQYTPGVTIRDLYLNCNGASQSTGGGGIYARGAIWCVFDHLWIETPWGEGIRFYQDGTGNYGHHNTIQNCLFRDGRNSAGGAGLAVKVQACDENLFTGCTFQDCGTGSGGMVYDTSAGLSTYSGCHFVGGGTGVPMMVSNSGPGRCVFTGCQFDSPNGGDCMILYGPGHTITGNMFLGIGIGASAKVAGVHFAGASGCIVQGNVFYSASATHAVAVCEDSGTGPNIIGSNTVSGTWGYGPFQTNSGGGSFISPQGGTGAPAVGGNVGDYYLRDDTPGTASQRLYVCTTAGLPGAATWTGIL